MRKTTFFALLLCACGSETGRSRVDLEVEVAGIKSATFANDHGWEVTLTEAQLVVGPLYFFEGPPLFTWTDLFISTAYAHPGHYVEGEALADVLTSKAIDLLADAPVLLGTGNGVTGDYNSVRFEAQDAGALAGHSARIAGTATRGEETINFTGTIVLPKPIEGIAFGAEVIASGRIKMEIDLAEWVRRIDFERVTTSELEPGTQPHNALLRGVENTAAFKFTWIQ